MADLTALAYDERTMQEQYEYECLLHDYGQTPMPEPVPDPTEQEMEDAEERAISEEVERRKAGPMVYVSREVVRTEREIERIKERLRA